MSDFPELPTLRHITLGDYSLNVSHYLTKEYVDISEAAAELPAIIEWINEKLQEMIESRELAKCELKRREAAAFFDFRKNGFDEDEGLSGKPTDKAVEYAIELQESVKEANENLAVLEGWVSRLKNQLETFRVKFDLIRSTEATRRKDYETT